MSSISKWKINSIRVLNTDFVVNNFKMVLPHFFLSGLFDLPDKSSLCSWMYRLFLVPSWKNWIRLKRWCMIHVYIYWIEYTNLSRNMVYIGPIPFQLGQEPGHFLHAKILSPILLVCTTILISLERAHRLFRDKDCILLWWIELDVLHMWSQYALPIGKFGSITTANMLNSNGITYRFCNLNISLIDPL